uniref:Uncharacterized protein n=1 Tax=Candidatus Kentrum sp. MB TaxID=2138164 RepID=A0A450XLN5_9GAMM|nr:MAG: hypothetical protein BECKMB1821G_GA0114241_106117 [Candidatus Kentron sp. MB]VFK34180.1 MAG: hypothetical protein BECKMB1821I_GA0114274_106317 [Candidatus Kentron sp. MB]VFK76720.1 MAG: hypothetical protein BECKMB1821H_GA0114242_10713 [Candidatus Kentron sp. MB]
MGNWRLVKRGRLFRPGNLPLAVNQRRMRPIREVPYPIFILLVIGFVLQLVWHGTRPGPHANPESLPNPPATPVFLLASLGDPLVIARLSLLWLQAFDNQPGANVPFRALDYHKVREWLMRIVELDPRGEYPLLAASLYAQAPVREKQRLMLDFVHEQFLKDPNRRWPWLAHGVIIARHRLKEPALALQYARAITDHATSPHVPDWARDMSILILEDMGEWAKARALIARRLDSGNIKDNRELEFLKKKRGELERIMGEGLR